MAAVSSGNRNFEGRVHPLIRLSYLGSPPLVVAYALAGTVDIDFYREEIGKSKDGKDIFLKDIWPTNQEIKDTVNKSILPDTFINRYRDIFVGDKSWESISIPDGSIYEWSEKSTYIQKPGFFDDKELYFVITFVLQTITLDLKKASLNCCLFNLCL